MLKRIAWTWRTWLLLSFAGLTLYVGFYAASKSEDLWSYGQKLCMMAKTEGMDKSNPERRQEIEKRCTDTGLVIRYVIKDMFIDNIFAILAVLSFALTISILLAVDAIALDDDQPRSEEQLENMTFAGLGYVLLVKRKSLLAALVLTLIAIGLAVYYLSKLMGVTLETEGSTLTIKLPGQDIHYIPIHSQVGWQNTGIKLKAGQEIKYSITGAVSSGYLQDIDIRSELLRKYTLGEITKEQFEKGSPEGKWPFTGPEGYLYDDPNWYEKLAKKDEQKCEEKQKKQKKQAECKKRVTEDYKKDTGLTVQGIPHNRVVGITLRPGKKKPEDAKPPKDPNDPSTGKPGYKYPEDKAQLIEFEVDSGQVEMVTTTTKQAGVLWVVINDAEAFRWDNAGLYFMKLVIRR